MGKSRFSDSATRLGRSADENAVLRDDEPIDSVEVVGQHAIKMGWLEKETEDSLLGGCNKRSVTLSAARCCPRPPAAIRADWPGPGSLSRAVGVFPARGTGCC